MENTFFKGKIRNEAFEKLKIFMANPGRFCVIVVGKRGTGKKFAIEKAFESHKRNMQNSALCLSEIIFVSSSEVQSEDMLSKIFHNNISKTVVFEDIEEMSSNIQNLLFKALETDNGKLGLELKVDIRVIFTSSVDIENLRTERSSLRGRLWERISQLIVEFPSFSDEKDNIVTDFKNTWNKMKFKNIDVSFHHIFPNNTKLQAFLEYNASKFQGGFRDLDKIAILYFNYRILFYKDKMKIDENIENEIVERIKLDFLGKIQLQTDDDKSFNIFEIDWSLDWKDILKRFKKEIKNLGKKKFKTISKLEEKLGLGKGTTKNW